MKNPGYGFIGWLGLGICAVLVLWWIVLEVRPAFAVWRLRWPFERRDVANWHFDPSWLLMEVSELNVSGLHQPEPAIRFVLTIDNAFWKSIDITEIKGTINIASVRSNVICGIPPALEHYAWEQPIRLLPHHGNRQSLTIRQSLQSATAHRLIDILDGHSADAPIVNFSLAGLELVGTIDANGPLPPCPIFKDFQLIGPMKLHDQAFRAVWKAGAFLSA